MDVSVHDDRFVALLETIGIHSNPAIFAFQI
jgi:hypothetical protein